MSQPTNVFQSKQKNLKTGNIQLLTQQVAYWQKLTQMIQPLLPQPEQWQVACYQHGVLVITGENQAMISQLAYLQKHYVTQLAQLHDFHDLQKIQVRLRQKTQTVQAQKNAQPLSIETQQMLQSAAKFVSDPKLSQALLRLASVTK
ncbi:MAG: DciA family protein [Acinetobacter sp.]